MIAIGIVVAAIGLVGQPQPAADRLPRPLGRSREVSGIALLGAVVSASSRAVGRSAEPKEVAG